jgi:hypothetical protein|tara:strand:+ start:442 stop:891 length:450 start_codon:yes stop_codon:yes gene_type:complete
MKKELKKDIRGLSNIIVTLLMIVLVLTAVGIIWASVQGLFDTEKEQISLSTKCLAVDISASLICGGASNDVCNVTMTRGSGGDAITGVKLVITNDLAQTSYTHDASGNIEELGTKTELNISTGITNASSLNVVPYFTDSSGGEQLCSSA